MTRRISRTAGRAIAAAGLLCLSGVGLADQPFQVGPNVATFAGTGGDSVSGAGEWSGGGRHTPTVICAFPLPDSELSTAVPAPAAAATSSIRSRDPSISV